jgi:hypothetical protein
MQFFLGDDESINIGQTAAHTISTHKVGSAELNLLTTIEGRGCYQDDLLAYERQLMSFVNACPNILEGIGAAAAPPP